ncbi:flippase [Conexibacter stalactiti]|uniref:Flippase n=1 Tax=Conexibacter stalactiti TaxID=1940611 RepID=A0ABU4HSQ5_9ACTN|nr:flippase [Conexibacter stalactiti]MDW5596352.1 flippase [Conexibacter stalactiti]MEC5036994.1 flippase [Conexibacter stalactiti]
MIGQLRALPRRLLHGGAAGEAGAAGGQRIASNVVIQLIARGISMPISVITVSLAARTLDPDGFGVWSAVGAYVGIFAALTDLGFTTVAMQKMSAEPEREAEWLGALAGARGMLSLIAAIICAASIPIFLDNHRDGHLVGWILCFTIFSTGANALMAVFQSRLRSGLALSFSVLQSFIWLGVCLAFYLTGATVVAFAIAYVVVLAIISGLQIWTTRRYAHIAWREGRKLWGQLSRTAIPLGIASVLITVYYQIDAVLLLQISGPDEAGIYGAAYRFLTPLMFLPAALMSSFFPVLSAVHRSDPARVRRLVQICADYMAVISLPILAVTVALSDEIVELLYGPEFARTAGLLPILMIAFVSICYGTMAGFLAPLLNLHWRLALYSGIGALANVGLNLLLIPAHGAYGSAWATVSTEWLTMVLMLGTALLALRLPIVPWRIARVVAVTAVMVGAMELTAFLGLFPAGLIGLLVYVGGLFALRVVKLDELRSLRGSAPADDAVA